MTTTTDRETRRERLAQEMKALAARNREAVREVSLDEIMHLIKTTTNLAYLFHSTPVEYTTRKEIEVNAMCSLNPRFNVPSGTKGWLFSSVDKTYDRYEWNRMLEARLPADGAKVIATRTYYTFVVASLDYKGEHQAYHHFTTVDKTYA